MKSVGVQIATLAISAFCALSCNDRQNSYQDLHPKGAAGDEQMQLLALSSFTVVDESGQPISAATILVGFEPGNPFPGNELTTDDQGKASVPAAWKAALPVTVQAPDFIATTIPVALPGELRIQLSKMEGSAELEVQGTANGYGRLITDGKVDFGLIIPALSRAQLLAFDISSVISPKTDTIEIIGNEVGIPTNISLPRQTENYIFPITLNKPDYRLYMREQGTYTVSATHGQFPLQRVVNDIRAGKSIFEVVNHFTFIEGGQAVIDVQGNVSGADLPVNQTAFSGSVSVQAPQLASGQVMMALALVDQNGMLMPTDVKRVASGTSMNLKSIPGATASILSLLLEDTSSMNAEHMSFLKWLSPLFNMKAKPRVDQNFNKLSFVLNDAGTAGPPLFLPLINAPVLNGNVLELDQPDLPTGLEAVATYLVYSEVEQIMNDGKVQSEKRTRLWEVWATSWLDQVELPQISFPRNPDRMYRWEVLFLARPISLIGSTTDGQGVDLNTVTHVTRNAADI